MVFYETFVLIHAKFPASETKLLMRETARVIVEREGALFRILDLGWRHTAKALYKKEVGHIFYGRWYSLVWGGSPKAKHEVEETLVHNTGVVRKVKELCMTTDEQCMTYSTAGISTCDESLVVCSCGTPRAQDASTLGSATMSTRQEWMGTAGRAEPHSSFVANSLKSKCLEVETLCTVKRNLLEHGLPLMLRTVVLGNRFAEYFVCIHKGGEHFSLLDRKVSRDKNNFHYAWEDMQKYHFVEYDGHTEEAGEVANERKELWTNGYYTREMMRCTFSESCCPQQMDMMFRSKEALQCVVDIFDSKLKARRNQTSQTSISPSTQTPSCHGAFNLEDWAWTPSSPEHQVWVPSPESTPQAVNPSTPLPTMAWPSPSPKSAEVLIQPPETDSERPPDWASMSERSLNSFYAV